MSRTHPLFNVDNVLDFAFRKLIRIYWSRFVSLRLLTSLKITSEVLKEGNLLLKFLGIFSQSIFFADILPISTSSFVIVKMIAVRIENNLGGVVKIYTSCFVG